MKFLNYLLKSRVSTSEIFSNRIQKKIGVKISNKNIYKEAFTHSSTNLKDEKGKIVNFERLEFLGDALLTSIIADYLYLLYPESKEGFLTKMRAKIVSRSNLNRIGKEMGLFELVKISNHHKNFGDDIHGNLLESLIGALFIDQGYKKTKDYVVNKIIAKYVDINNLNSFILSYKAFLIEWGQKEKKEIKFYTEEDNGLNHKANYCCQIFLGKNLLAKSKAHSKKKAEEKASRIAIRILKLNP